MAERIHSYYLKAGAIGGAEARAKLSILTMVNSYEAQKVPDSDENILMFEKAMNEIVRQFNSDDSSISALRLKLLNLLVK